MFPPIPLPIYMNAVLNQPKYFSTCRRTKKSKSNVKNRWMILGTQERKYNEGRKEKQRRRNEKARRNMEMERKENKAEHILTQRAETRTAIVDRPGQADPH